MPHGTATGGITSFDLLEYCIGGFFKEAGRRGYRGAGLDQMRRLLVVTRADLRHEFYVGPPRWVDPDVYPDEEPKRQLS